MAEVKNIKINVDTAAATKSMDSLSNATKEVAKEFDTAATFAERYGEELQPLTTRMGEAEDRLYELAAAGQTTSQEYKDLLKTVGDYRKVQIKTDMAVDAAATTLGQKLGGALNGVTAGFSAAQGIMGTFGVESEQVESALLKVQSAMAIQQGIEGIRESISSFKALGDMIKATSAFQKILTGLQWLYNTALAANPVVAIVAGFAALLAVGYKLITMFQESAKANEQASASIKKNTEALNQQIAASERASEALKTKNGHEYNMAKASGASAEALRKLALKHADEEIALEKATLATAKNTYEKEKNTLANYKSLGMSDEVIEKQRELVTKSREALKEEYTDLKEAYKNRQAIALQNQVEVRQEQTDAKKEALANAQSLNDEMAAKQKEALQKRKEELAQLKGYNKEATDFFKSEYELQVEAIDKKYAEQIKLAKKYKQDITAIEKAQAQELEDALDKSMTKIETTSLEKFQVQQRDLGNLQGSLNTELQARQQAADLEIQILQSKADRAAKIEEQANSFKVKSTLDGLAAIASISELFGKKSEKAAKRAFQVQKAANIATALITTYQNATSAYASQFLPVPDPSSPIRGGIAAGIAVATGLANVAKITQQKFEGGGSSGGGGGAAGGGGSIPTQAPSFNVVGNSGVNQLAQLQQQPVQAYVVSGQVTTAQSLDRNRVENATL